MKKYLMLFFGLLLVSCGTAPKIDVANPHADLLSKTEMEQLIIKRYFSYIHCRNAKATLLEIQPIIKKEGKDIIPVVADTVFQEIKGMGGWLKNHVKALYHFHQDDNNQWKVNKIKAVND